MYVTDRAEILIEAAPRAIWDYVTDPEQWTASNPDEHYGLTFDTSDNRTAEGATFHQQGEVAGMFADLHGRFPYVADPRVAVWAGSAYYPAAGGLLAVHIPEGGTLKLEEEDGGTRMSHAVWMDFPDSWWGRLMKWFGLQVKNGQSRLYEHTHKELVFFKNRLESDQDTA